MDVNYSNESYRPPAYGSGKLIKRAGARIGDVVRTGANRAEAKAALLDAVEAQCCAGAPMYLFGDRVTLVIFYADGWRYHILRDSHIVGSCLFDADSGSAALKYAKRHFDQLNDPPAVSA